VVQDDLCDRFRAVVLGEDEERDSGCAVGVDGEVHPVGVGGRTERMRPAGAGRRDRAQIVGEQDEPLQLGGDDLGEQLLQFGLDVVGDDALEDQLRGVAVDRQPQIVRDGPLRRYGAPDRRS
jgi:hypothetical protein